MINACELCAKITLENILQEKNNLKEKMEIAQSFAEEIISPIIKELHEIPNHLFIGYRHTKWSGGLYLKMSEWRDGVTGRGWSKKDRFLTDRVDGSLSYSKLDYEILNQYLAKFGFQISWENKWVTTTEYSSYVNDLGYDLDFLYLSMICPDEEK